MTTKSQNWTSSKSSTNLVRAAKQTNSNMYSITIFARCQNSWTKTGVKSTSRCSWIIKMMSSMSKEWGTGEIFRRLTSILVKRNRKLFGHSSISISAKGWWSKIPSRRSQPLEGSWDSTRNCIIISVVCAMLKLLNLSFLLMKKPIVKLSRRATRILKMSGRMQTFLKVPYFGDTSRRCEKALSPWRMPKRLRKREKTKINNRTGCRLITNRPKTTAKTLKLTKLSQSWVAATQEIGTLTSTRIHYLSNICHSIWKTPS